MTLPARPTEPLGVDLLTAMPGSLLRQVELLIEGAPSLFVAGLGFDPEVTCYPAGQATGGIDSVTPAGDIVHDVVAQAERILGRIGRPVPV